MSLVEGLGVGFRWVVGGGLPVGMEAKGKEVEGGWGGGVGTGKGTGKTKPLPTCLSKIPFSKLPKSFSPIEKGSESLARLQG